MRCAFAIALCLMLSASAVRAQDAHAQATRLHARSESAEPLPELTPGSLVALLPPATSGAARGSDPGAEAVGAVSEILQARGFRVLSPAKARAQLEGHTPDGCENPATCDPELALATLGADAVVSIAVWQRPGSPAQVVVSVRRERGFGQAEVKVERAALREAARRALRLALEDSRRTHEVVVSIESEPSGAELHVDQLAFDRTPAQVPLLPGNHLISLEAPGYVSRAQYIEVPERAAHRVYRLQLSATSAAAPSSAGPAPPSSPAFTNASAAEPSEEDHAPSALNYVVATALFGLAAPLLANAIYSALTHGDCVGQVDARNRCAERVSYGPLFYGSLALGSLAAIGGGVMLIVRPISGARGAPSGAQLEWQRAF